MMSNLFSSFDPSTGIYSLNWMSTLFSMFFSFNFFILPNHGSMAFTILLKVLTNLDNELNNLMSYKSLGSSLIFMGLFYYIYIYK